jgi:A/G-specific adenine glycosylase
VGRYPVKEKKKAVQSRNFNYLIFILKEKGQVFTFLNKRSGDDIWKNLYEFPLVESDRLLEWDELGSTPEWEEKYAVSGHTLLQVSGVIHHILSHRRIKARYFMIRCGSPPEGLLKVRQKELVDYPMPRLVEKLIDHSNITFFDLMD